MALKKTLTSQNQNNPRPLALMDNITINKNSIINDNSTIGPNVFISEDCYIGRNVCISNAFLGKNTIVQDGTVIGQDGFGYVFDDKRFRRSSMDYIKFIKYKRHLDWDNFFNWSDDGYDLIIGARKKMALVNWIVEGNDNNSSLTIRINPVNYTHLTLPTKRIV